MTNIIVIGSSGHAKCVLDSIALAQKSRASDTADKFRVVGLLDDYREKGERTGSIEILGAVSALPTLVGAYQLTGFIVAIGDNFARAAVISKVQALCPELDLVSAIHPSATVAQDAHIGAGTVVMAGAVVAPGCLIGRACILNTAATIDHESRMADYSSLAPRVVTGGNCQFGAFAAVGIGAIVSHRVHVGAHSVVGAGALVLQSIDAFSVAYGSPARHIRTRVAGEKYL